MFIILSYCPVCLMHPLAVTFSTPRCVFALYATFLLVTLLWLFFFFFFQRYLNWGKKQFVRTCECVCECWGSMAVIRDRELDCSDKDGWCFSHPKPHSKITVPCTVWLSSHRAALVFIFCFSFHFVESQKYTWNVFAVNKTVFSFVLFSLFLTSVNCFTS